MDKTNPKPKLFNKYEVFLIAILTFLQFTIILDFMVLSPLGVYLIPEMNLSAGQFSFVVSAYAVSAGISGLLAAGFADKFDRKILLLFFYTGFVFGTLLCGIATSYTFLLVARIVTGIFGGVIGSISFAIVTDIFRMELRGRVMGFIQMAFASSQVLGLPIGLYLAEKWGWHSPFLMIVGVSIAVGVAILLYMRPVDGHLKLQQQSDQNAFRHLGKTLSKPFYLRAFTATTLMATGGFMLMPFGTTFGVFNMGMQKEQLKLLYMITGISAMIAGPLIGRLSDKAGKFNIFAVGSLIGMCLVIYYCGLGITPFWQIALLNVILFVSISARMISASALMTAVPEPKERGAFMSINSATQYIAGGIASIVAGQIVVTTTSGKLEHYDTLGYVVAGAMVITLVMIYFINKMIMQRKAAVQPAAEAVATA